MTEDEQALLKGGFAKLADKAADVGLLRDAAEELEMATDEIQHARQTVAAVAGQDPKVPKPTAS